MDRSYARSDSFFYFHLKYFRGEGADPQKFPGEGVDRCNKRITSKKRISNFGNRTARESPECGFYNAKFIFYLSVELVTSFLFSGY